MTEMKYWRAVNHALSDAMAADDRVIVLGQDVGTPGGPYGLTRRLLETYGSERVRDTPISEAALVGAGVGSAISGLRPIIEIMFLDFMGLGLDQLLNQAAKYEYFSGGRVPVPLVISTLYGGRQNMGAQHSQSLEAWLCHTPGISVAFPSTPHDAYWTLRAAIDDDHPTVVINSIALLRSAGSVEIDGSDRAPVGTGNMVKRGAGCTLVSYGPALRLCQAAVEDLDVEVIDLRWLSPWPRELVCESVKKTSRLLVVHDAVEAGGWGAEIVATITADAFWHLDAPPRRLSGKPRPLPVTGWESELPSTGSIRRAATDLLRV